MNNQFHVQKITWNQEMAISRLLCHLDLDLKILVQKFSKAQKFLFLMIKVKSFWLKNLLILGLFLAPSYTTF